MPVREAATAGRNLASGVPSSFATSLATCAAAGRAKILATAIGEESFTDVNASGFWQTGDAFDNLGEPYRDDNENGEEKYSDSGELVSARHIRSTPGLAHESMGANA